MQCPSCKSDNVQRLKVIYEGGTHNINTTSTHAGGGYGYGGAAAGGGTTTTTGKSQSIAARKAAPPSKRTYKTTFLIALVAVAFLYFGHQGWLAIGIIILGVAAFLGYRDYRYNTVTRKGLYEEWARSWQCNKCGMVYAV